MRDSGRVRPNVVVAVAGERGYRWRAVRTVKVPFGADPLRPVMDGHGESRGIPARLTIMESESLARQFATERPGVPVVAVSDITGMSFDSSVSRIGRLPGGSSVERIASLCEVLRWWPGAVPAMMRLAQSEWAGVCVHGAESPSGFYRGQSGSYFKVVPASGLDVALRGIGQHLADRFVVDELLTMPNVPVIKIKDLEVRRGLRLEDRFNGEIF